MATVEGGVLKETMHLGGSYTRTFGKRTSEDETGTAVDLTAYASAAAQLRDKQDPTGALLAEFTCVVDGPGGNVTISLSKTQMDAVESAGVKRAYADVFLVNDDDDTPLFVQIEYTIDPHVTVLA